MELDLNSFAHTNILFLMEKALSKFLFFLHIFHRKLQFFDMTVNKRKSGSLILSMIVSSREKGTHGICIIIIPFKLD